MSWTPFVSLFIARISRGRTVRQFISGVLLVPSVISLSWFAVFGGGAIGLQERAEQARDTGSMLAQLGGEGADINFDTVLFDLLGQLGLPSIILTIVTIITVVLIAIFFVTGADSASIVMGSLSENGAEEPSKFNVIFWGVSTGAVAAAMLLAGGDQPDEALEGLKNITIVSSVPFVIVLSMMCVSIWKDMSRDPLVIREDLAKAVLDSSVTTAIRAHEGEPFVMRTTEAELDESNFRLWNRGRRKTRSTPQTDLRRHRRSRTLRAMPVPGPLDYQRPGHLFVFLVPSSAAEHVEKHAEGQGAEYGDQDEPDELEQGECFGDLGGGRAHQK